MLKRYIRSKLKTIILFSLFSMIFAILFFLYSVPMGAVLYGILLCSIILLIFFIFDYASSRKKYKTFQILKNNILTCFENLPEPKGVFEKEYYDIICNFDIAYRNLISSNNKNKTEMLDFYTLWVHQIKTPISAMSVILQESNFKEKQKLMQELFKIERYTELVLSYLRIDNISSDLMLSKYNIDKIIKQAVKKYAAVFIYKKIKLETSNLNLDIITDEKWLTFVIEQLLSNALKYTNKGTIKIYADNNKKLFIEDSGIGISEEDLPRVFEKGFTGFNGRMDKKSTGLGLYLCKRTLEKLHHKIKICSQQDIGTKVIIDLSQNEMQYD